MNILQNQKQGLEKFKKTGKVHFIASVYTHLAAFHIPFMKLLQKKGYDIYAVASSGDGRR